MRKSLFFAFFIGLLSVGLAHATDWTDGDAAASSYPDWATGKPTTAAQLQVKDANITTATTNYVVRKVGGIAGDVATLANAATSDNVTVTANGTAIGAPASSGQAATGLFLNRIDAPSGSGNICPSTCGTNGTSRCECGYISANGTSGTKQWVVIQK